MKKTILYIFVLLISTNLVGQSSKLPISVGYFAPYGLHPGLKISTSLELKNMENNGKSQTLSISPQIGYFAFQSYANVSQNMTLEAHLDYKRYAANKWYGLAGIGLGYHANFQKANASVNLGTGAINYNTKTNHFLVPTLTVGLGKAPEERLGYYFKVFTGQRLNASVGNEFMLGAEIGLMFYLNS